MVLNAPAGWNVYALAWNPSSGHVWNGSAFIVYVDGDRSSYAVAGSETSPGVYTFDFSAIEQAATVAFYKQAGGSPATSDPCVASDDILKPVGEVTLTDAAVAQIVTAVTSGVVGNAG